jgi:ribonuclease-3
VLEQVQRRLAYRFQDHGLLTRALTHASARTTEEGCNERLEFLGDAVLGLVVAEHLYSTRPEVDEGTLTRVRAHTVSAVALADWAGRLGLAEAVALGKGLDRERLPDSVLANLLEALLGAVYLDGGLEAVRPLVLEGLADRLAASDGEATRDWKSLLQEATQQIDGQVPSYEVVAERGPDHDKQFQVRVLIDGEERGRGAGNSKKAAEQAAAEQAWEAGPAPDDA